MPRGAQTIMTSHRYSEMHATESPPLLQDELASTPGVGLTGHAFNRCGAAAFIKMGGSLLGLAR